MRPLLTMSEDDFRMCRENEVVAANSTFMLLEEIDAQRADLAAEHLPDDAAVRDALTRIRRLGMRPCDMDCLAPSETEALRLLLAALTPMPYDPDWTPETAAQVDAATIRRQAIDQCIAAWHEWRAGLPAPGGVDGRGFTHADGARFMLMLEALRDPADAREAWKE